MKKALSVAMVLLVVLSLAACGGEKIVWGDLVLGEMLPEPPVSEGEIHINGADELWIDMTGLSDKQFNDYVEACKEMGFTVDAEADSSSYTAYNAEGYKLSLDHYGNDADMRIQLEMPMEMTTITWPTSTAGNQLPIPKSTTGKFSYEYEDSFLVYVGNTSRTDYAEYVNACNEKGFHVDYSKGEDYYYADNSEGWHISVCYEGNNIMSIDIDAPSEDSDNKDPAPATQPATEPPAETTMPAPTEQPKDDTAIDPEFKAAMDRYEAFFDEYVDFMKSYNSATNPLGMMGEYASMMQRYAQAMEALEKIDENALTTAELQYYNEVMQRINQKLLGIS